MSYSLICRDFINLHRNHLMPPPNIDGLVCLARVDYHSTKEIEPQYVAQLWSTWKRYGFHVEDDAEISGIGLSRRYGIVGCSSHVIRFGHSLIISDIADCLVLTDIPIPHLGEEWCRTFAVYTSSARAHDVLGTLFALVA